MLCVLFKGNVEEIIFGVHTYTYKIQVFRNCVEQKYQQI